MKVWSRPVTCILPMSLNSAFRLKITYPKPKCLDIIYGYCNAYKLDFEEAEIRAEAIEWQATRGSRSGRVAWQYFLDLAGRKGLKF